jgi:bifunctional non-homologous end joining protein LigD
MAVTRTKLTSPRRARVSALPKFVSPQKATLVEAAPTGADWLHEMKLDGYRSQLRIGTRVSILTSSGLDWTAKFGAIAAVATALRVEDAILDGEITVMLPNGVSDFGSLQDAISEGQSERMCYWAFDLLYLNGRSLLAEPLEARKTQLRKLLDRLPKNSRIRYSDHVIGQGAAYFDAACTKHLEGIISKRRNAPYRSGRTDTWLKVKCRRRQEFVIGGWKKSDHGGVRSLLLGTYDDRGQLVYAGHVGTGFKQRTHVDLMKRFKPLETARPTLTNVPREDARHARWLKPELVAEIEFAEWTGDNVLRHPSFKGLREDKDPRTIRREEAAARS